MNVLAIDPSKRCGFAHSNGRHGVWLLGSQPVARLERLDGYIRAAARRWPTDVIAYESATFGSRHVHAMRRHNELAGVIELCAAKLGAKCWSFPPTQWKAIALACGNADKAQVMRLLELIYGVRVADQDAADAIGILKAAERGPPPETRKQAARRVRRAAKKLPRLF
jgi:Holliday junction resolvasome RuvABC endonuclease subunit